MTISNLNHFIQKKGIFEAVESVQNSDEKKYKIDCKSELERHYSPYDLKRLASYSYNLLDYHVIQDLVPQIARQYFSGKLKSFNSLTGEYNGVQLSVVQSAILCGMGLQKKLIESLEKELGLSVSQILALFAKSIKRVSSFFEGLVETGVRLDLEAQGVITNEKPSLREKDLDDEEAWDPTLQSLEQDLLEGEKAAMSQLQEKQKEVIDSLNLDL